MSRRTSWNVARPWLAPLVPFYAAGAALRSASLRLGLEPVRHLGWPAVSVGSLSAGGAGKTPFVIALAALFTDSGLAVDVLSRGYGRRDGRAARVDPAGSAEVFGDEPILVAQDALIPVYVGARRIEAGRLAETTGAPPGVHLLDDGFQHRQLARDVDIALVSSADLQDWLLPAGNLREPLGALGRADVLAIEARDEAALARLEALKLGPAVGQQVWRYRRSMRFPNFREPVLAFCGIARAGQFFAGIRAAGIAVAAEQAFPDHHRFKAADLVLLRELALRTGAASLMTTAKDLVRLRELPPLALPVNVAELVVELEDWVAASNWLQESLREPLSRARAQFATPR
jgi:tetraacyldisaccharide 4'-kinase